MRDGWHWHGHEGLGRHGESELLKNGRYGFTGRNVEDDVGQETVIHERIDPERRHETRDVAGRVRFGRHMTVRHALNGNTNLVHGLIERCSTHGARSGCTFPAFETSNVKGMSTLERTSVGGGHVTETYRALRCLDRMRHTRGVSLACVSHALRPLTRDCRAPRPRHVLFFEEK